MEEGMAVTQFNTHRSENTKLGLGRIGIWSGSIRYSPEGSGAAAELEALGFETVWVPGGIDSGVLESLDSLLDATSTLKLATGIINIWKHEPADVAAWWHRQTPQRQARLLLGLGVSHGPLIGEGWQKPLAKMRAFLDGLVAGSVPPDRLCLAALGPKMLQLAAERTAGAHPYMASPRHTAFARKTMGPDAILAPEQGVVFETDPDKAREIARGFVKFYAGLPNYANNWRRDGFSDAEIEGLRDRLIDALIAWGDIGAIAARLEEHFAAGADHVCLQVIGPGGVAAEIAYDRPVWRQLAVLL
jgi:probable F420-dependent oxidoreductase